MTVATGRIGLTTICASVVVTASPPSNWNNGRVPKGFVWTLANNLSSMRLASSSNQLPDCV
ncbi:hypothetical protein [Chamaesiphon sp.]|uniref:hypothetical protein n=1 Tax=Chamaesiphon sp. TaxID=2814140 RepID=UPI003594888D